MSDSIDEILPAFTAEIDEIVTTGDVEELAATHLFLANARRELGDLCRQVEDRLVEVMPDDKLELPGLPVMERRHGYVRKHWDSEAIFNRLIAIGSLDDIKACLPLTGSLGWRVSGLRAVDIDPDEFCERSQGRATVQIHEAAA